MKPTVSETKTLPGLKITARVDVDNVVNIPFPALLDSPVKVLNRVVLPAEVYPAIETVGRPAFSR